MNILIAGDYVPWHRIKEFVNNNNFKFFEELVYLTKNHDLSIINLEAPIVSGNAKPIEKCGPNLKTSPNVIGSLQYAGFNMVTLANNHIMDYGKEGLDETITCLKKGDIKYVGVGDNLEDAAKTFYFEKDGKRLAIINCCEHEFSIADPNAPGANPLNPIKQYYAIQEAREKADFVLVIVHGGHEEWQLPSPRMVETYRFFIDSGADAVVNHHQHCFSGYEIYENKPIFYGLGNFCFDWKNSKNSWNEGYMVSLNLNKNINFDLIPYEQCKNDASIKILDPSAFSEKIKALNEIINNKDKLKETTSEYYRSFSKSIQMLFEPYNNKFLKKMFYHGLLPKLTSTKKIKILQDYISCESHREKLEHFFKG